jgi:hypothetical protein
MSLEALCWPDTIGQPAPADHPHRSALWLLGRHVQLAVLVARVPGATGPDDQGAAWPWLDLDALADAICAHDAHSAAWANYERRRPAPQDDDAYDRWRAAGPSATPAASAVGVMSGSERTRLRLLATFSTVRVPLRASDVTSFDAAGQARLADWCEAVQAV